MFIHANTHEQMTLPPLDAPRVAHEDVMTSIGPTTDRPRTTTTSHTLSDDDFPNEHQFYPTGGPPRVRGQNFVSVVV